MRLQRPADSIIELGQAAVVVPEVRKERSVAAKELPYGRIPGYAPISADVNDPNTMKNSLQQRLCRVVPTPHDGSLNRLSVFVAGWLKNHIRPVDPMEFEDWLESTSYNLHRKQQLRQARESTNGRPTMRRCSHVKMFGKRESYPEYKHARMINSRVDEFKAYSGPMFKAIEEELYSVRIGPTKQMPFVKHMTPEERMERVISIKQQPGHYFATDFTAYESHFTPEVMNACECLLYKHCLQKMPDDAEFICKVLCGPQRLSSRGGVHVRIKGRRMSGDMCTSLGNGFTNLMLALFVAHEAGAHLDGIVEGDDGLFVSDIPLNAEMWKRLGFTIKLEEVRDPCKASFCGLIFGESGQIIRDPRRFFQKFGWTESFVNGNDTVMHRLLLARALSALHETPQCPIVGLIARRAVSLCAGYTPLYPSGWYKPKISSWASEPYSPSPATRQLFAECYGISVEQQLAVEALISTNELDLIQNIIPPNMDNLDYESRYLEHRVHQITHREYKKLGLG